MGKHTSRSGFTLIELIIYIGIFSIAAGLLTGVLTTFTRVQVRESATTAVSQEAQFVIQTIQRLVTDASLIELTKDAAVSTLKLRMPTASLDPTCIQFSNGTVYLMQGNDGINKQTCFATSTSQAKTLTTNKVVVTALNFTKFENPPSTDTIKIDLTVSYNSTNPQESVISRTLQTAIAKVSAATFDSDIIPATDATHSVGIGGQRWKDGYFSGNVGIETTSFGTGEKFKIAASSESTLYGVLDGSTSSGGGNAEFKVVKKATAPNANIGFYTTTTQDWVIGTGITATDANFRFYNGSTAVVTLEKSGAVANTLYLQAGNVGIGTTSPSLTGKGIHIFPSSGDAMIKVQGSTVAGSNAYFTGSPSTSGNMYVANAGSGNLYLGACGVACTSMIVDGSGNVGIGTTGPNAAGIASATVLTVSGSAANNRGVIELRDPNPSSGSAMGIIAATANTVNSARIEMVYEGASAGRFDFYTHNGTSLAERMRLLSSGTLSIGSGSGKLNVGTIDPIYNIGGTRYATYVPAIAGKIREEVMGTVSLRNRQAVIDFDDVPRESDLWLFWQITDFGPRWDDLVVIPAAGFDGRVWYKKDPLNNRLIFSGDRSGEISFRLSAPRFDHEKWGNVADEQTGGFDVEEKR